MIEVCRILGCVEIVCGRDSALHCVLQYKDSQTSDETGRRQAGSNAEMGLCSACNSNPTEQGALDGIGSYGFEMRLDKFKNEKSG